MIGIKDSTTLRLNRDVQCLGFHDFMRTPGLCRKPFGFSKLYYTGRPSKLQSSKALVFPTTTTTTIQDLN